jgi:FdhD protein
MKRESSEHLADWQPPKRGMRSVMAHRIEETRIRPMEAGCWVVEEQALRVEVQDVGHYTLMCTPTGSADAVGYLAQDGLLGGGGEPGALALAAGFLLTEGLVNSLRDVASMAICPDNAEVVTVRLFEPGRAHSTRRSGLITSSCGMCANVDGMVDLAASGLCVGNRLALAAAQVHLHMQAMRTRQAIFSHTGGTHAAALFDAHGTLLALAEDLGRHNALDKVIGQCLLHGLPTVGCCVLLSGRESLEMITKAARAGIEMVAAVSAPSSMAIDAAHQVGMTLCGFVRDQRLTAFSHPQRLVSSDFLNCKEF